MHPKLTYLILMLFTIAFPLASSWDKRVYYAKQWKYMWPGMLITAAFMIGWDIYFTKIGVWAFNDAYVLGLYLFGLPIEEWLFFFCVPFSCIFIYEVVKFYFPATIWQKKIPYVDLILIFTLAIIVVSNSHKWYTMVKLTSTVIALAVHYFYFGGKYLGRFYLAFLFTLIPFLLVNGILTWLPVVAYDNTQNLNVRISDIIPVKLFNIPIEDVMYSMLLLLMNVSFLEFFRERAAKAELAKNSELIATS
jgi:lycopene cyclase domain-containing protein